ncbi:TOTE conflict system archaeo-eukaryotic primase domain-containing protein [uncultured Catenibacterium sp.]|uniref:TOTE conflict system archaeo-eukaryotic primase domain-containing protein n=1 Tax=uncultured Catenibacterium sp. TaxID=286142 RepID=UPI0025D5A112|nr:DEAD/DEAH box helicase family protein [uncultured Catenibacterium sp.]
MNLEGQNLESLRRMIRHLQEENKELKELLKKSHISFNDSKEEMTTESIDEDAYIKDVYISDKLAAYFLTLFQGRRDVYALRGAKGGYFPQCFNRWKDHCPKQNKKKMSCQECPYREWKKLDREVGKRHLLGYKDNCTDVIGLYPLLEDDTCKLLVFDFDNHDEENSENNDWKDEIDAIRKICHENGIDVLIERSRSGNGAHAWILFKEFVPASLAREFGLLLIEKGAQSINLKSFRYYDRMFPTQDHSDGLGNLVALPLQGQALRQGNSAFVDENWNAYYDQWKLLSKVHQLTKSEIEEYIYKWKEELLIPQGLLIIADQGKRVKPWKKDENFHSEDVIEKLSIVLADGIYVDTLNLKPRIQNQIRRLAAFDNPVFYKNHNLGYSNWNQPRVIYLGEDINDYIKIPRGLLETLLNKCDSSNIAYEISDKREKGKPINVSFTGKLRDEQPSAASDLLSYDNGVLNAATAFGKTVVSSYLISQRKVNTLIVMQSVSLINQWVDELHHFLEINEDLPMYKTKTGKEKQRKDLIGVLHGSKNTLTGIIDVVSVNSIYDNEGNCRLNHEYGMVIVDECHHGASHIFENVLRQINSKYVYGVSANEKRIDRLEKKVYMQLGPIRHQYTSKERIEKQTIDHYVYPRFTKVMALGDSKNDLNSAYAFISKNENRNNMIISDIKKCIEEKRTPIVLTRYKEHAKLLYETLKNDVLDHTYLIYGDHSLKENEEIRKTILSFPHDEPFILIATSQSVGEGFNVPRLDTLFLTSPVSGEPLVDQFLGRINRDYKYKESAIVYDYVDSHIHYFNNMYKKRLSAYRKIGFDVITDIVDNKQNVNHIYNYSDYLEVFRQDIHESNKSIIISSPQLNEKKVLSFIELIKDRQEKGVSIIVFTKQTDDPYTTSLIDLLYGNGVFVEIYPDLDSYFAVIDQEIVWHGGINLLGKSNIYDSLMRVKSTTIAEELIFSPTETKDCDS